MRKERVKINQLERCIYHILVCCTFRQKLPQWKLLKANHDETSDTEYIWSIQRGDHVNRSFSKHVLPYVLYMTSSAVPD